MVIVMAGGGTGGHLFPALALVEEFKRSDEGAEFVFVGGKGGIEEKIVPARGFRLELLDVVSIKKRKGLARFKAFYKAAAATFRAMGLLKRIKPDGVIGCGSYSSGPVVLAARLMGIRTAILEQNTLPGLTNRLLGKFVDRVYTAFEGSAVKFPSAKTVVSGNPVRRGIVEAGRRRPAPAEKFRLLIFGGSQGAQTINAAFLDATEYLTDIWGSFSVVHQSGEEGFGAAREAYARKGLKVELESFIEDMAGAYAGADLVVCRAGATSIAEITALGLASILVPYPFSTDGHQAENARYLALSGAAATIMPEDLTGSTLAGVIRRFFDDRGELKRVGSAAGALGRPEAARTIVGDFTGLLKAKGA